MVRRRDRIIALVIAIAFFATSFALSFFVILELVKGDKATKTGDQSNNRQMLQGTKLADFTPLSKVNKLQKTDLKVGTGKEAKAGDEIIVDYTGAIASTGIIFQSSLDLGQPASLLLKYPGGVIKGWVEGIPGMKEGGKRRLIIPTNLAYGSNPPDASIPKDAALVFDVTLISVGQ